MDATAVPRRRDCTDRTGDCAEAKTRWRSPVRSALAQAECLARQDVPHTWHSQEQQDIHIAAVLKYRRGGFFVDLAANEPVQISNTRALERDYGWSGICIEPNARYWPALRERRRCMLVTAPVSNVEESRSFAERGAFSSLRGTPPPRRDGSSRGGGGDGLVALRTRRLDSILAEHAAPRVIDYLSLDGTNGRPSNPGPAARCCCANVPCC